MSLRLPALALLLAACHGAEPTPGTLTFLGEPPTVVSVHPEPGAIDVPVDSSIVVRFSEPVQPDSGTAAFTDGRPVELVFNTAGDELIVVPTAPLGSLTPLELEVDGFVDADGLVMAEPLRVPFQTELVDRILPRAHSHTPGRTWAFVDVAAEAGLTTGHDFVEPGGLRATVSPGAGTGDLDGDNFIDIYFGRGDVGRTTLYRNRADGTFADITVKAGVVVDDTTVASPIFVDHDGDADLDLLVPAFDEGRSRLFRNDGNARFTDVTDTSGLPDADDPTHSVAFGDYDNDLDLDAFFARFTPVDPKRPLFLLANEGGTFVDATQDAWLFYLDIQQSFTPNFADMDDDGWPELLIASDHHFSVYLRANGDGTYRVDQKVELTDENGMGAAVGDFDNDGDLDWFVASIYDPSGVSEGNWGVTGNRLYENQGDGHLVDISEQAGVRDGAWGWGACAADVNNDGLLDIFHVNGWIDNGDVIREEYAKDHARLFLNQGDGTFDEVSRDLQLDDTSQGRGLACFDYDRDGDIDLLVSTLAEPPRLLRNDSKVHGHFLNVRLAGRAPNTEGVGARVYVTTGPRTQLRELRLGSNYGSNDPVEAHFGLGDVTVVDELRVRWPDGLEVTAHDVRADRFVVVTQP